MSNFLKYIRSILLLLFLGSVSGCAQSEKYASPKGYHLNKPQMVEMHKVLYEISGIAFRSGNADTVYAIQDEDGKLFFMGRNDPTVHAFKFSGHGDYEDLTIIHDQVFVLRSDGMIYSFFLRDLADGKLKDVTEWKDLLPAGEFESMYGDEQEKRIYVLCKRCPGDKSRDLSSGYIFKRDNNGTLTADGEFTINVKAIDSVGGPVEKGFHPSAISRHPISKEWYILSSVNKILVVTDTGLNVKKVFHLDPSIYNQPEGMAFDKNANLYISNEGGDKGKGTILKLEFHK